MAAIPLSVTPPPPIGAKDKDPLRADIDGAKSHDLIFAIVGHVGAGATHVAGSLVEELRSAGYQPLKIKASDLIAATAGQVGLLKREILNGPKHERTIHLQDAGDQLRKRHGPSIVAGLAIRRIFNQRKEVPASDKPLAFVIDSLKNPHEVEALREVYRNAFYLIGVICGTEQRTNRLQFKYKDTTPQQRAEIAQRDDAGPYAGRRDLGQNVRDTLQDADFFISNEESDPASLGTTLKRTISIITGQTVIRPQRDERGMYAAWSASLRSSCMSRQVGAAIMNETGEILSTGANDVPRYGGGLYQHGDAVDRRCFVYKGNLKRPYCRNDQSKIGIYDDIFQRLKNEGLLAETATQEGVKKQIEQTAVRDLIEFSRAVHAEMDALLSIARTGGATTSGSTLFCTTYPCHSCARHIVASGVHEVVYIEPYVKSRAAKLHDDSILETTKPWSKDADKVHFRPFSGVAPRRFASVFKKIADLKDKEGFFIEPAARVARHHDPVFSKDLKAFEEEVARRVEKLERGEIS